MRDARARRTPFPVGQGRTSLALVALIASAADARAADPAHPLVLELFQSQGCAACPPAEANVALLAKRPDILALGFAVTYWDRRGWKDTFAQPIFTKRQVAYVRRLDHGQPLGTPEVVVNGRASGVGADPDRLATLIRANDRGAEGPVIALTADSARISAAAGKARAEVWLVRYDPRLIQVPIKAGENGGKTLPQRNIVRQLVKLGDWTGADVRFAFPRAEPDLETAVLVQGPGGGPILAAATTH